jgi:hypothetical protein
MSPKEQLAHFVEIIKREGIVDRGADERALQTAIKTFINNNRACERYVPRHYAGPMVVLRAREVQRETEERTHGVWADPSFDGRDSVPKQLMSVMCLGTTCS